MIKVRLTAALALLMTLNVSAQSKYGATSDDSLACIEALSLYGEFYNQKNYADAKPHWLKAMTTCPKSSKNLYIKGVRMYKTFMKENRTNSDLVKAYIDTVYWIYDRRIESFGEEGKVLGMKGFDMMRYNKSRMAEAHENLAKSVELQGVKSNPAVVAAYYQSAYELYKKDEKTKADIIELYDPVADILTKQLDAAIEKQDEKAIDRLKKAMAEVEKIFSTVASCDDLVELYQPKFEEHKEDTLWLGKLALTMGKAECETDFYLQVSEQLHSLKPGPISALSLGIAKLKKEQFSDAAKYCLQAYEMGNDKDLKMKALKYAATSYSYMKQFSNAKKYALKWLELDPNSGEAYMIIGDAYLYGSTSVGSNECEKHFGYIAAVAKYQRARSLDDALAAKANKRIASAQAQFPKTTDCFIQGMNAGDKVTVGGWIGETVTLQTRD